MRRPIPSREGRLAQLGERLVYTQEVAGSNPAPPTSINAVRRPSYAPWAGVDISHRTILLCEDDQNLRQLIRVVIGDGYRFVEAIDGDEAVELAATVQPDLVILDLMLPKLSGLDVLARIRELAGNRPCVIVMSAWADAEEAALAAGADRFLPKPFELDDLSDIVRETLDGS